MAAKEFPEYKYGTVAGGKKTIINLTATLLALIILFAVFIMTPLMSALLILPVIIIFYNYRRQSENFIMIGQRYLIIGTDVIYYKNVEKAELHKDSGKLIIHSHDGKTFEINSASFPTNAQKPEKIEKNRTEKFNKTAEKIYAKLREASPESIK